MKKPLLALPLLIMALLALVLAWAFLSYPADYVLRILRWGDADVYDYQKFPERVVAGSPEPFTFTLAINEQDVQARFEASPLVEGDLDQFLTDTGTQAFLVIQNDQLLYEKYYNGAERDTLSLHSP
jgi:hypothetical protein